MNQVDFEELLSLTLDTVTVWINCLSSVNVRRTKFLHQKGERIMYISDTKNVVESSMVPIWQMISSPINRITISGWMT